MAPIPKASSEAPYGVHVGIWHIYIYMYHILHSLYRMVYSIWYILGPSRGYHSTPNYRVYVYTIKLHETFGNFQFRVFLEGGVL